MQLKTEAPEQTYAFGKHLASVCKEGLVLCLEGDLGAGKTLFVQGLANGLHVEDEVTSPTFALMNIYHADKSIYHFDLYRLDVPEELQDIGFYEYTEQEDAVVIIEWADKFIEELPENYIWIKIQRGSEECERIFDIRCHGETYQSAYKEWIEKCQF